MASPELVIKIIGDSTRFTRELKQLETQSNASVTAMSRSARIGAAGIVALGTATGIAVKQAAAFETALIGVGKTTDIAGDALKNLGDQIQTMAAQTGIASSELLGIAQSAGQLGVSGTANILKFTETVAKLGTASNLSGEMAATTLARLINVTGGSIQNVDRLASVIVRLGNNFAATESEIAFTAQEIAKAGAQFGFTAEQASALGAAFTSLGVQPELARSSVLQTMVAIRKALDDGGKDFTKFQQITGLTGDQLRQTFEQDATEVFRLFLEGLNKTGGDATKVLADLGLGNTRLLSTLPTLAGGINIVNDALSQMQDELVNTNALNNEFKTALGSTENQGKRFREAVNNIAVDLGEFFTPAVNAAFSNLADKLEELRPSLNTFMTSFAVATATIAGSIGDFITLVFKKFLADVTRFTALTLNTMADLLSGTQNILNRIPGVDVNFSAGIKGLEDKSLEFGIKANEMERGANGEELNKRLQARLDALRTFTQQEQQIIAENEQAKKEIKEEAGNVDPVSMTDDEFEDHLSKVQERFEKLAEEKEKAAQTDLALAAFVLKNKQKFSQQEIDLAEDIVKKKVQMETLGAVQSVRTAIEVFDKKSGIAKALFVVEQAAAVANTIINTQEAITEALKLPPPQGEILAAARAATGAASVATIAGTTIASFDVGAMNVPRDMIAQIHQGETILPKPFAEEFRQSLQNGGGMGQNVSVQIDLTERASQFVTVNQRQDSKLGVQR